MIYIICFALSVSLIAIAEKRKTTKAFLLWSGAALLIPCLLAGLRAEDVGRDVTHYVKPMLELVATTPDLGSYLRGEWMSSIGILAVADYEYGFSLLVYVIGKLTGNLQVLLFFIEAAVVIPVYVALARNRKNVPMWLAMLVFYLLFYNATLNLMRQMMAMALLLLGFQLLQEKKWLLAVLVSACALLFHYSSALVLLIYCIYWIFYLVRNVKFTPTLRKKQYTVSGQTIAMLVIVLGSILVIFRIQWVRQILLWLGIERFEGYLKGKTVTVVWKEILLRLPLLAIFAWNWKHLEKSTPAAAFYMTMLLMDLVVSQLTGMNPYTFRIAMFFALYTVYSLPIMCAGIKNPVRRDATVLLSLFYLVSYWGYLHIDQLLHHTYPYHIFH